MKVMAVVLLLASTAAAADLKKVRGLHDNKLIQLSDIPAIESVDAVKTEDTPKDHTNVQTEKKEEEVESAEAQANTNKWAHAEPLAVSQKTSVVAVVKSDMSKAQQSELLHQVAADAESEQQDMEHPRPKKRSE